MAVAVSVTLIVVGTTDAPLSEEGAMGVMVTVPVLIPAERLDGFGVSVSVLDVKFVFDVTDSHWPPPVEIEVLKAKLPLSVTLAGAGEADPTCHDQETELGEAGKLICAGGGAPLVGSPGLMRISANPGWTIFPNLMGNEEEIQTVPAKPRLEEVRGIDEIELSGRDREGIDVQQLVNRATHDVAGFCETLECHLGGGQIRIHHREGGRTCKAGERVAHRRRGNSGKRQNGVNPGKSRKARAWISRGAGQRRVVVDLRPG
jgi:hypothetical protein